MGRIILFVRVSTIGQQLESQEDLLKRAALADGYSEADFIVIGKKESAIKLSEEEREGLNELKNLIETEEIECVYIAELSRLSRRPEILYSIRRFLFENKVQLKCLKPSFTLLESDRTKYDGHANIIFSLFGALAEQEMLEKKERFARGKRRKADEGKYNGGAIPFGYRIDAAQDNLIVVDDKDSKIVKEIFDKYENGFSQPKLAKEMAETGRGYITISLINHVLNNESYYGKKRKSKYASYERTYPPIITQEQFERCRKIADENNSTLSKAKNIYFAEHLIKCPSCGAYWSAGCSKASYHCPNAYKPMSIWKYENHRKEKCTNRTSCSINIIDSILWHVAIEKQACYIEQANQETIDRHIREKEDTETKLASIKPRLEELDEKMERLSSVWVDGSIKRETYERKKQEITEKRKAINLEKIKFEDDLKRIKETIKNLIEIRQSHPISVSEIKDFFGGKSNGVATDYPFKHELLKEKIKQITDDNERKKIVQRQIKSVEIIPTKIRFPFGIGIKDIKSREIVVHSYIPSFDQKELGAKEGINFFFTIAQGGSGPMILDIDPDEYTEGVDPTFHNYRDGMDYYFTDITDEIFMLRYRDVPKRSKRDIELEKKRERIGDKLSLSEAIEIYGVTYSWLWNRIQMGVLSSEMIIGKHFVYPKEVEEVIRTEEEEKDSIGGRMTILSLSKKYNVAYSNLMDKASKGLIPSIFIGNKRYAYSVDVERYLESRKKK